mgnify:CR=1 FL=1
MCISKKELESKVQEVRNLKTMKEEIENELKAVEHEIIAYMTEHELDTEFTSDAKITYKPQTRTTLDKKRLVEDIGSLEEYEKTTSYSVLRIK